MTDFATLAKNLRLIAIGTARDYTDLAYSYTCDGILREAAQYGAACALRCAAAHIRRARRLDSTGARLELALAALELQPMACSPQN